LLKPRASKLVLEKIKELILLQLHIKSLKIELLVLLRALQKKELNSSWMEVIMFILNSHKETLLLQQSSIMSQQTWPVIKS